MSDATIPVNDIIVGDCLDVMRGWPDGCVDLVFGSPPYENARTYGIGVKMSGEEWVEWFKPIVREAVRITRGLACFVVAGMARKWQYHPVCEALAADLWREGIHQWRPAIYQRVGIPGSGGRQGFRNDWEFVLQFAGCERSLPWADNLACGQPCKYKPGGRPSHRKTNGDRVNSEYKPPRLANPGNVVKCKAGGGHLGSKLAHENEAPFPESLAERWVQSYCPPGGVVLDPFSGSGTTAAVAERTGRQWVGIDIRESQQDLTRRRVAERATGQKTLFDQEVNP